MTFVSSSHKIWKLMDGKISLDTPIEELIERFPEAVGFLSRNGVRCIRCGEPLWCSLGELLKEEGIENLQYLVKELNDYLEKKGSINKTSR
jgi:hypothetical protein